MSKLTLAGILLLCCGAFAGETVIRNGTQVIEKEAIATTSTDGIAVVNPTLSTSSVTVQTSPRIRQRANAWDTAPGNNDTYDFWTEVEATSGTTTTGRWSLYGSKAGAAGTRVLNVDNSGSVWVGVSTQTELTAAGAAIFQSTIKGGPTGPTTGDTTNSTFRMICNQWHSWTWTAAMVVAGRTDASTSNVLVCTVPAKTVIRRIYLITTAAATGVDSPTVSCGRTGTDYIDYTVATAPGTNTVIGDALAEVGVNLKDSHSSTALVEDFAGFSFAGTTAVYLQFKCDGAPDINQWAGGGGVVYLETYTLP